MKMNSISYLPFDLNGIDLLCKESLPTRKRWLHAESLKKVEDCEIKRKKWS